jgi:hypothetical protein
MLTEISQSDQISTMHLVIPGMMVIQLGEDPELKAPSWHRDLDNGFEQEVRSKTISSAAPEESGTPQIERPGGLLFEGSLK